jgi:hypothetical protein
MAVGARRRVRPRVAWPRAWWRRDSRRRSARPLLAWLAAALIGAAGSSCGKPAPRPPSARAITSLTIIVVPPGGGQANSTFLPDGTVRGGHLSGDPRPMVYQDEKHLDSATVKAIWTAARALGDTLLGTNVNPDSTYQGYVILQVTFDQGPMASLAWPFRGEHADARVRALVALLMEHRTGGW